MDCYIVDAMQGAGEVRKKLYKWTLFTSTKASNAAARREIVVTIGFPHESWFWLSALVWQYLHTQ